MKIFGLQKLTLLDYPEKVACTVFTGGCNFRCPFCHNSTLIVNPESGTVIDESALIDFLKKRTGILDGVCVSGGEPLLQPDIEDFLSKIKALGFAVKLDTNGGYPAKLKQLIRLGLADYVAMDIKNTIRKYPQTIGVPGYDTAAVEESAEFLMTGAVPYEFRTTVVRELHSADDFAEIGSWLKAASKYYLQTFIDSENVLTAGLSGYAPAEMASFVDILRTTMTFVELRGN